MPVGLREAAGALGMSYAQTFRYVVLKPAVRNVLPALTNQLIVLFLFSSVGSVISLDELTSALADLNQSTLRTLEIFTYRRALYYLFSAVIAASSRAGREVPVPLVRPRGATTFDFVQYLPPLLRGAG